MNQADGVTWEPVERTHVARLVAERLISMIRDGHYKAGDRLPSQRELVEKLKVSRPTLREALSGLQMLGYLEARSGAGYYAREMQPSEVLDFSVVSVLVSEETIRFLYEARAIIDTQLAELAAVRATEAEMAHMADHIQECERLGSDSSFESIRQGFLFHQLVAEAAHNPILAQIESTLLDLCGRCGPRLFSQPLTPGGSVTTHGQILGAIRSRDRAAARRAALEDLHLYLSDLSVPIPGEAQIAEISKDDWLQTSKVYETSDVNETKRS
jgi:GntR family transcriptional repressor for pyruvate dehydrogenase complex